MQKHILGGVMFWGLDHSFMFGELSVAVEGSGGFKGAEWAMPPRPPCKIILDGLEKQSVSTGCPSSLRLAVCACSSKFSKPKSSFLGVQQVAELQIAPIMYQKSTF